MRAGLFHRAAALYSALLLALHLAASGAVPAGALAHGPARDHGGPVLVLAGSAAATSLRAEARPAPRLPSEAADGGDGAAFLAARSRAIPAGTRARRRQALARDRRPARRRGRAHPPRAPPL